MPARTPKLSNMNETRVAPRWTCTRLPLAAVAAVLSLCVAGLTAGCAGKTMPPQVTGAPGLHAAAGGTVQAAGPAGTPATGPPAAPPQPGPEPEGTLAVVGDVMLARGVATAIARQGVDYPFAAVAERLRAADYTFANLESPLGVKGKPIPGKGIWFRAPPESVRGLLQAGIDGVTLANNHILDYDTENFLETLGILREHGIGIVGGGEDLETARRPLVARVGGVRVAFLGYSQFADIFWDWGYRRPFAATDSRPGVAPVREETLAEDIARARERADVVAVAYHWGDEYVNYPNPEQRRLARKTIDLGADLVLGFHPHAVQGIERYREGLIAYSLGNFVMDQKRPVTRESMILEIRLTPEGISGYEVVPVMIDDAQPRILEGDEARALLDKIDRISEPLQDGELQATPQAGGDPGAVPTAR